MTYLRAVHGPCVQSDHTQALSSAHCVPKPFFRHRTQQLLWSVGTGHRPSTAWHAAVTSEPVTLPLPLSLLYIPHTVNSAVYDAREHPSVFSCRKAPMCRLSNFGTVLKAIVTRYVCHMLHQMFVYNLSPPNVFSSSSGMASQKMLRPHLT